MTEIVASVTHKDRAWRLVTENGIPRVETRHNDVVGWVFCESAITEPLMAMLLAMAANRAPDKTPRLNFSVDDIDDALISLRMPAATTSVCEKFLKKYGPVISDAMAEAGHDAVKEILLTNYPGGLVEVDNG